MAMRFYRAKRIFKLRAGIQDATFAFCMFNIETVSEYGKIFLIQFKIDQKVGYLIICV